MHPLRWLDPSTSLSWRILLEKIGGNAIVYCIGNSYPNPILHKGITYHFVNNTTSLMDLVTKIRGIAPDMIMYNLCYYDKLPKLIRLLSNDPQRKHIVRVHHETKQMLPLELLDRLRQFIDLIIVPTEACRSYIGNIPSVVIPFGVDIEFFRNERSIEKKWDVVSATSNGKLKNLDLVNSEFKRFEEMGLKVKNFIGLSKRAFAKELGQSKYFYFPSISEASGSRSLLEAISAGCHPLVSPLSISGVEVVGGKPEYLIGYTMEEYIPMELSNYYSETTEVEKLLEVSRREFPKYTVSWEKLNTGELKEIFELYELDMRFSYGFAIKMKEKDFNLWENLDYCLLH